MFLRRIEFATCLKGIRTDAVLVVRNESLAATGDAERAQKEREHRKEKAEQLTALRQQAVTMLESVQRSLQNIMDHQRVMRAELAQATVELAVLIAENVVRRAINENEYGIHELVAEAIERLPATDSIVIHLHPSDKDLFEQQRQRDTKQSGLHQLHVQADPSLDRGDCYIDGGDVGILTAMEQHLAGLRHWLLEGLEYGITATDTNQGISGANLDV